MRRLVYLVVHVWDLVLPFHRVDEPTAPLGHMGLGETAEVLELGPVLGDALERSVIREPELPAPF